MQRIPVIATMV